MRLTICPLFCCKSTQDFNVQSANINLGDANTDQIIAAGNIDAIDGLDVTNADLNVGTGNFIVAPGTGNATSLGTVQGVTITDGTFTSTTGNVTTTGTLNADGAVNLAASGQATTVEGSLAVTEATTINGDITIGNAATDAVTVTGEVRGNDPLAFEGTTDDDIYTTFRITDPLTTSKTITFPDADGTVVLQGATTYTGDIALTTDVGGNIVEAVEAQDFNVQSANINLGDANTDQIIAAGNIDAIDGLDVTNADLNVGTGNFIVAPGTGNATSLGTVQGVTITDGTFTSTTGNVTTTGTLNADGAVNLAASGQATTVEGSLAVTEATTINGDITIGNAATDAVTVTGGVMTPSLLKGLQTMIFIPLSGSPIH